MPLTPQIVPTPGTPATYNPNIAETFSWLPVQGAGRELYAKATYDIAGAQALGQNGFTITNINDTAIYSAGAGNSFTSLQMLTSTKFVGLSTLTPQNIGTGLNAVVLPQGFTLNGPIFAFQLAYGAVVAYKA